MVKDFEHFVNRTGTADLFGKGMLKFDKAWQNQLSVAKGKDWKYLRYLTIIN